MNQTNKQLYWCDCCSHKKLDKETNKLYTTFFNCNTQNNFVRHLDTSKHLSSVDIIENSSDKINCEWCNTNYSVEGYEHHKIRNSKLWMFKKSGALKTQRCNNFYIRNHRFESLDEQISFNNRRPQKRTEVGKISKVTGMVRTKNKKAAAEHIEIESDEESDGELDRINNELDQKGWATKKDGLQLTIEELDYTERPKFDEFCDTCGYGINYNIPSKIIERWDIDTCSCPDSDDTDSD